MSGNNNTDLAIEKSSAAATATTTTAGDNGESSSTIIPGFTTKDLKPNGKKWGIAEADAKGVTTGAVNANTATASSTTTPNAVEAKRSLETALAKNGGRLTDADVRVAYEKLKAENGDLRKYKDNVDKNEAARLRSLQKSTNDIMRRFEGVGEVLSPEVEDAIVEGVTKAANPELLNALSQALTVYSKAAEGLSSIADAAKTPIQENEKLRAENATLKAENKLLYTKLETDGFAMPQSNTTQRRFQDAADVETDTDSGVAEDTQDQEQEEDVIPATEEEEVATALTEDVVNEMVEKRVRELLSSAMGTDKQQQQKTTKRGLTDSFQAQEHINKLSFNLDNYGRNKPAAAVAPPATTTTQKKAVPAATEQQQKKVRFATQQQQKKVAAGGASDVLKSATSAASVDHQGGDGRYIKDNQYGSTKLLERLYREARQKK